MVLSKMGRVRAGIVAVVVALAATACGYGGRAVPRAAQPAPEQCGGTVSLHVVNENMADVRLFFPGWTHNTAIPGFSEETIRVPEESLKHRIGLRAARGGSGQAFVDGGNVTCDDATLVIGSNIRISFFYGADVRR